MLNRITLGSGHEVLSLALFAVLALGHARARPISTPARRASRLKPRRTAFPARRLSRAFDNLEPNDAPSFLGVQPEFATPIWDYMAGLVDDERVRDGQAAFAAHRQAALAAERRFGVDAAAVVAVWGVEFEFRQEFRHAARDPVADVAGLPWRPPQRLFSRRADGGPEDRGQGRREARGFQRLLGRRLRQHPVHAFDLPAPRRRHGWRRAPRRGRIGRRRLGLDRQFPVAPRIGTTVCPGASRWRCPGIIAAPRGEAPSIRWRSGRNAG